VTPCLWGVSFDAGPQSHSLVWKHGADKYRCALHAGRKLSSAVCAARTLAMKRREDSVCDQDHTACTIVAPAGNASDIVRLRQLSSAPFSAQTKCANAIPPVRGIAPSLGRHWRVSRRHRARRELAAQPLPQRAWRRVNGQSRRRFLLSNGTRFSVELNAPNTTSDLVARLQSEFPNVVTRDVPRPGGASANPKVRDLLAMLLHANCEWLLLSDSNVRVPRDYLREVLATQRALNAGLVTHRFSAHSEISFAAMFDAAQLNGFIALGAHLPTALGDAAVVGNCVFLNLLRCQQSEPGHGWEQAVRRDFGEVDLTGSSFLVGVAVH
jgi:hypothetical protein